MQTPSAFPGRLTQTRWLVVLAVVLVGLIWIGRGVLVPGPEAAFARHMIPHHDQAIEMARMLETRTSDPNLKALASDIIATQASQINQMQGWLAVWQRLFPTRLSEQQQAEMGMASQAEMNELQTLSGNDFEVRFLQLMIRHHQGAIVMIEPALATVKTDLPQRLLLAMKQSQTYEIEAMQKMLEAHGGKPLAPPAPIAPGHGGVH